MRFLTSVIQAVEARRVQLSAWLATFASIVFIRAFIENFSSRTDGEILAINFENILHFASFYILTLLGFIIIIHLFTQKPIAIISRLGIAGLSVILVAPLIDLLVSSGNGGRPMMYLFLPAEELWRNYFTWYGAQTIPSATVGIRIELIAVHIGVFWYVWFITKSFIKGIFSTVLAYSWLFFLAAFPSIFLEFGKHTEFFSYYFEARESSFLQATNFYSNVKYVPLFVGYDTFFEVFMLQHFYLLTFPLLGWFGWLWNKSVMKAVFRNFRPERIGYYLFILFTGMLASVSLTGAVPPITWINILSTICLSLTVVCAWLYVLGANDIVDSESDAISNPSRPLITGAITRAQQKDINLVFLALTLVGAYALGQLIFILIGTFLALAYVYSTPPLHVKRFPFINPFVMALAALTIMLAGFFLVHPTQSFVAFPTSWLLTTVLFFFLVTHIKDIKDISGDRAVGVYTLPVLLGERIGVHTIGALSVGAILLVPIMLGELSIWLTSIVASPIIYALITRKQYRERDIFIAFFAFFIVVGLNLFIF